MPTNQPFALKSWTNCSPELRPAAQEILDTLSQYAHAYFDLGQHPASPDGFVITPHTESSGKTWLELRADDMYSLQTLRQCMFTTVRQRSLLTQNGLGGAAQPELNYAPLLGLYQVL
jgi:hypothetical protein